MGRRRLRHRVTGLRFTAHPGTPAHNLRSSNSSPRSPSDNVCWISARCACSLQSSNLSPIPSSTAFFLDANRIAMAGRDAQTAIGVQLEHGRRTHQFFCCSVRITRWVLGLDITSSRTRSHSFFRVQPQASGFERVVGEYQAVAADTRNEVAVCGWHRHTPLVVHRDGSLALKHRMQPRIPAGGSLNHEKPQNTWFFPPLPTLAAHQRLSTTLRSINR